MRRRAFVSLFPAAGIGIAGCIGGPSRELKPVSLEGEEVEADSTHASLEVDYAATVSRQIPTEPPTIANDGMKWLFVRMQVTNTGSKEYKLSGAPFVVKADGEVYEIVFTRQEWELPGRTIQPSSSTSGWMVFQIPLGVTEAILTVRKNDLSRNYSVTFTRNTAMDTTLPDQ